MYCRECGKPLLESDKFCSNCGTPVKKIVPAEEPMFKTEAGSRPSRTKTAPLPSFTMPEPAAEEPKGERMIFEAIGDSIKWDTDIFPDKTKAPKKTEDVDFHWNLSEDEFRNRPSARKVAGSHSEPSLWSDNEARPGAKKSTGLKPSDTNSWEELFEGTRSDDKNTRQAPGVGRSSVEAYWEDMFRRGGGEKKASRELPERPSHRVSISRDDIRRGIGDEGSERLDQNKLEDTMTLSRSEMEGAIREEQEEKKETRENREVAELASLAAAGIGAGPTFVPEGVDAVSLPEIEEPEKPAAEEKEITGEELEKELFADMEEPMTEAQKMRARQTEKIDKFYTFNKKNEEFQKLLDQEYERFKQSREEDDFAEDLYKLGDENFFEDYSREGHSQAEEMARARQTLFHTDEYAALKALQEEKPAAEEEPEDAQMPAEESPEEAAAPEETAAEEPVKDEPAAESPETGLRSDKEKKKKSFLGRLFGKEETGEIDKEALTAAAAAAGLTGAAVKEALEEEPAQQEQPEVQEEEIPAAEAEDAPETAADQAAEEEPAAPAEAEQSAEEAEEEPVTASIVFEPEEEPAVAEEQPEEKPAQEEPQEEPAAESPAEEPETAPETAEEEPAEAPAEEEATPAEAATEATAEEADAAAAEEEPDLTKTASIVFEPEQDEPVVNTEPAEPEEPAETEEGEQVPRTTEPTRVYEKGDIPSPTTEEERASQFEESRAEAWDAFFSDDEDVNAGNTFDAERDEAGIDDEKHGASIAVSILAVILVILLALIVIRLAMPDSIISIKLDQITEKILHLFNSGIAGSLL